MDTKLSRGLQKATKQEPAIWIADNWSFSAKDPSHIFGALFMEKIDLGNFGQGIQVLSFQNAVDPELGATIRELSIGAELPQNIEYVTSFDGWVNTIKPNITNSASTTSLDNDESIDALENIITYNITGQLGLSSADIITSNRNKLKNIVYNDSQILAAKNKYATGVHDKLNVQGLSKTEETNTDEGTSTESTVSDIKPDTDIKKAGFADVLILTIIVLIYAAIIVNLISKLK